MNYPAELLDAVRSRYGIRSDYALARFLNQPTNLVSRWRAGKGGPGDAVAAQLAGLLDLDAGYVLARLYAERATDAAGRAVWEALARRLAPAVAGLLAVLLLAPLLGADGAALALAGGPLCIMSNALWVAAVGAVAVRWALTRPGDAPRRHTPRRLAAIA